MEKSLTWSGYKLQGRTEFQGLKISIENRKGTYRKGTDPDGHAWRTLLHNDYGYIRGSVGVDGDHVDCFLGPVRKSDRVYIVHQVKPGTDTYDEDKVLLGFRNRKEAVKAYLSNYDRKDMLGSVDRVTVDELIVLLQRRKGKRLEKGFRLFPLGTIRKHADGWREKTAKGWKRIPVDAIETKRRFMNGRPLAWTTSIGVPVGKTKAQRVEWAEEYVNKHFQPKIESEFGEVVISKSGLKSSIWHFHNRADLVSMKLLEDVIKNGMVLQEINNKKKGIIGAPVKIDGVGYYMVVSIKQSDQDYRFHVTRAYLKNKTRAASNPRRSVYEEEAPPGSIRSVLQGIIDVKPEKPERFGKAIRKHALQPKTVIAKRKDGTTYQTTVWVLPEEAKGDTVRGAQFDMFAEAGEIGAREMPEGKFVPKPGDRVSAKYSGSIVYGKVVETKGGLKVRVTHGGGDSRKLIPLTDEWKVEVPVDDSKIERPAKVGASKFRREKHEREAAQADMFQEAGIDLRKQYRDRQKKRLLDSMEEPLRDGKKIYEMTIEDYAMWRFLGDRDLKSIPDDELNKLITKNAFWYEGTMVKPHPRSPRSIREGYIEELIIGLIDDYRGTNGMYSNRGRMTHRRRVEQALEAGANVPTRVLREYGLTDATAGDVRNETVDDDFVRHAKDMPFVSFLMRLDAQSDATLSILESVLYGPENDDEKARLQMVREEIESRSSGTADVKRRDIDITGAEVGRIIGLAIREVDERSWVTGAYAIPDTEEKIRLLSNRPDAGGATATALVYKVEGRKAPRFTVAIAYPGGRTMLLHYRWSGSYAVQLSHVDGDMDVSDSDAQQGYHPLLWGKPRIDEPQERMYELIDAVYETRRRARQSKQELETA